MKNQKNGLYEALVASMMALVISLAVSCTPTGDVNNTDDEKNGIYSVVLKDDAAEKMTAVPSKGPEGTEVQLSVNEGSGYVLTLSAGGDVLLTRVSQGVWTFIMPAARVEIEATFGDTPSADASLSALSSSTGTWDAGFSPTEMLYGIEVESHVTSVSFDFTAAFVDADVTGTETLAVSGDNAQAQFVVTAQDGSTKTYTVVVFKMPNAVLEKVTITGTGTGYSLPAFDTAISSGLITVMLPLAQGKNTVPITYSAVFSARNTDSTATVSFNGGSDFTFTGKTIQETLNLGASKSGTFEVRASKTVAGKERVSTKSYTFTLERSDSATYPQASEFMAEGGQVIPVKTGIGQYDMVHLFFYDPENSENGQTAGVFTVNVPVENAQVLVLAGGGAGGAGAQPPYWVGAGGGAGGLAYQQQVNLDAGEITVKVGAGGTGLNGNNGNSGVASVFGDITAAGGGGGRTGASGKLGNGFDGGSGGGGTGAGIGGIAVNSVYGFKGGNGTGASSGSGGVSYGGGGGGAGGAGEGATRQGNHVGDYCRGGIGKTWEQLGNIVTAAMLSLPDTLYGLAGGGNGNRRSTERLTDEGPGYGGGLGFTFAAEYTFGNATYPGNPDHNAIANTGGGGGCGNGAGASGIVIIRYAYIQPADR